MKSLEKPKLPIRVSDILLKPLKIKFDITTLDMIISFIYKESTLRTRKTLTNIYKLVTHLDESVYNDNPHLQSRLWVIERSLYAKLIEGFETDEFIKQTCFDDVECDAFRKEVLDTILSTKKINYDESKALIKRLDDILEYGYTITVKDVMQQILNQIDDGDFKTYKAVSEDLYNIANTVINIKRSVKSLGSDQTFSLVEDQFDTVIDDAVEKLKDRNRIFITGIQRWNTL